MMFNLKDVLLNNYNFSGKMSDVSAINWTAKEVEQYLAKKDVDLKILNAMRSERVDGKSLLLLNERDLNNLEVKYGFLLGDIKRFSIVVNKFQLENRQCLIFLGIPSNFNNNVDQHSLLSNLINGSYQNSSQIHHHPNYGGGSIDSHFGADLERISPATSVDGGRFASSIQPELFKTALSMGKFDFKIIHNFHVQPCNLDQLTIKNNQQLYDIQKNAINNLHRIDMQL